MGIFPLQGQALSYGITITCGFSFMLFGWDQGMFGGILNDASFANQFHHPGPTLVGQIVSTYDIGCIIGALMSIYFGDKLGRRKSVVMSCIWVIIGGILQASAFTVPHMIIGRIIAGFGIGQSTAVVPMWQAETSKPKDRGRLVAYQMVMVIFGIALSNFVNLGMTDIKDNQVSWRFPIAVQCFWAIVTMALVPLMVESPRWLCFKERHEEAQVVLARLAAKDPEDPEVKSELRIIADAIAAEKAGGAVGWKEIFSNNENQTFRRICLGAGTSIFQQMGGINVVVYYFPVILTSTFGFSPRLALILSGIDFILLCFWGYLASILLDRVGRKPLMYFGSIGCGICFTLVTVGLGVGTKPSNGMAVAFMFAYHLCYGVSFLAIPFLYPSEINSSRTRSLANSIAMVTNWLFVYVIVIMTPSAIANISWRFYSIFAVLNFAWFPFIYFFYVETKGLSLEEVDLMFKIKYHGGKSMTYPQAAVLAKEQIAAKRIEGIKEKDTPYVETKEFADSIQ